MKIVGGARVWLEQLIAEHHPERVVSLLSPGEAFPVVPDRPHLKLEAHDICEPTSGLRLADEGLVKSLIDFGVQAPPHGCILVHCSLGVSRSPAAALVIACALRPDVDEYALARSLRTISRTCTPNPHILALADRILDRSGRLIAAGRLIGVGFEFEKPEKFELLLH